MPQITDVKVERSEYHTTLVTARSILSGDQSVQLWDIPFLQFQRGYVKWLNTGTLIQNALPMLDDNQREFLMTGITEDGWDDLYDLSEEEACE
jgi:hypothetical protein